MKAWFGFIAVGLGCLFLASSPCHGATIYACERRGSIRLVSATTQCSANETRLAWPDMAEFNALKVRVTALEYLLEHSSRNGDDISITGANLWIKNGLGSTSGGSPGTVNGLGNLIVGYNEERNGPFPDIGNDRTGSHNIIVGAYHNYSSYGGLVAGRWNTTSAPSPRSAAAVAIQPVA